MSNREKILGLTVAALMVSLAIRHVVLLASDNFQQRRAQVALQEKLIKQRQKEILRVKRAEELLTELRRRSLPANKNVAHGRYKQWLRKRLQEAELTDCTVKVQLGASRGSFTPLRFDINGQGTLEQLVKWLFAFYRADHLHKIVNLDITPVKDSNKIDLTISVEALILPDADRMNELSSGTSQRLAHDDLSVYAAAFNSRKLLAGPDAATSQPDTETEDDSETGVVLSDVAKQIRVTGVHDDGTRSQVWLSVRDKEQFRLQVGETFEVEDLTGTITSIDVQPRTVVIQTGGRNVRVALGDFLSDGKYEVERGG